ncbi:MAG: hypothetical protein ABI782_09215 [Anaerolineaceae bacterium]
MAAAAGWLVVAGSAATVAAADGPALTYRLFVPGVAADSPPPPPAGAVVTQHVSQAVDGSLIVSGEVRNGTVQAVSNVVVSAKANSTTRTTTALANQVAPGGVALFMVALPGITDANTPVVTAIVSYSPVAGAAATGLEVTLSGLSPLQVTVTDPQTGKTTISDSPTVLVMTGSLTNTSAQPVDEITVVLGFYDDAGNVRLVATTSTVSVLFRDPGDRTLGAGKSGTFEVPFSRAAYLGISGTLRPVAYAIAKPLSGP